MDRRRFIALLGAAITAARAVRAQQKAMPVIGLLGPGSTNPPGPAPAAWRQALSEAGYVDNQSVAIEYRWAEGRYDQLSALAADLVDRNVDVIAAFTTPAALAAKRATSTIPIVFVIGEDPVESGLVANFPRPGGNLTGFGRLNVELLLKRLELLSELVPQARVIALLVNPTNSPSAPFKTCGRRRAPRGAAARPKGPAPKARTMPPSPPLPSWRPARSSSVPMWRSAAGANSSSRSRRGLVIR